jgi:Spy/CpxP family protein refolding chaperone
MKSTLLVLIITAGLCAAQPQPAGSSQGGQPVVPPPGKRLSEMPHGGEFPFSFGPVGIGTLMKEAGISEAQMKQIDGIFEGSRHLLIDQRADVEKKEGDFQLLMQAATIDPVRSERALDALLDARSKLSKTQTMMMVKMRTVLTQEQWHKMEQMQRRGIPGPGPVGGLQGGPHGGPQGGPMGGPQGGPRGGPEPRPAAPTRP